MTPPPIKKKAAAAELTPLTPDEKRILRDRIVQDAKVMRFCLEQVAGELGPLVKNEEELVRIALEIYKKCR